MSAVKDVPPVPPLGKQAAVIEKLEKENKNPPAHWKGFVAGIFSGIAKLSVGHP
jgi:hypothetical protein